MEQERIEGTTNRRLQNLAPPPAGEDHPHHHCPRCNSSNTKFCYYNNYSLSQPRYFCRACRRYWTHGGTLRNVPIGGGCRRNKLSTRSRPPVGISSGQTSRPLPPAMAQPEMMGNMFYGDVTILPPFASMQPSSQFGVNLSLLQAMSLHALKPPGSTNQFQAQGSLFPAQQNLINQPMRTWAQNFHMTGSSSSGVGPSFMDQAGASFSGLNQGPGDNHPSVNLSRQ